jgi:hypothetical protein
MPLSLIKENLEKVGFTVEIQNSALILKFKDSEKKVEIPAEWIREIKSFNKTNQLDFDIDSRKLIGPKSIEVGISRLSQEFFGRPKHEFKSASKRLVKISPASKKWALSFLHSDEYVEFFEAVIVRRFGRYTKFTFDKLMWFPLTIEFSVPRKIDRQKLIEEGETALEGCLFKLAVERNECWDFSKKRKKRSISFYEEQEGEELKIPTAAYDSNMLKYFKVAVSSQFPSQSFLSFYHVLEYNFLSVSDEALHGKLKAHVNSTSFKGDEDNLEKVITIVKKHSDNSDETELLMRVLRKFVDEEELIDFIGEIEGVADEKLYSKNHEIFGEKFQVQLKRDHVISNVSKLLKHVRNALVHSSDRYNREDCHIPLTDSENIVENYIPLLRFLAEKVIYAKSS